MNKKKGAIITLVITVLAFSFKIYRKYERQRDADQKRKFQHEQMLKNRKQYDSIRRIKLDSVAEVNRKKVKEMDKILEILDQKK
jgi:hypothetical protein